MVMPETAKGGRDILIAAEECSGALEDPAGREEEQP